MTNSTAVAYISYEREDVSYAEGVSRALERAGIPVWIDKKSLKPGDDYHREIENALGSTQVFVQIVPSVKASWQWTGFELGYARAAGTPVILVLIAEPAFMGINVNVPEVQVIDARGLDEARTAELVAAAIKKTLGHQVDS